jgi:hypothetical protein
VAEPRKSTARPADTPAEAQPPRLARAGESGDAGVQWLLAERSAHVSNGDDAKLAEIDAKLAELGFTAQ